MTMAGTQDSRRSLEATARRFGSLIATLAFFSATFHLMFIVGYRLYLWATTGRLYLSFAPTAVGRANEVVASLELFGLFVGASMLALAAWLRRGSVNR